VNGKSTCTLCQYGVDSPDAEVTEANADVTCQITEDLIGDYSSSTCDTETGVCTYNVVESSGMSGGAVIALIIFIAVVVIAVAMGTFLMCKKKPEDAMVAHQAYGQLDGSDQL
jgi:hypothetical protein